MKNDSSQIAVLLVMVITGMLILSDEQKIAIQKIILGSTGGGIDKPLPEQQGDTISGMSELAQLIGVSIPTACKIARSGKFDAARLNFGTKKIIWDKAKLLAIANNNNISKK